MHGAHNDMHIINNISKVFVVGQKFIWSEQQHSTVVPKILSSRNISIFQKNNMTLARKHFSIFIHNKHHLKDGRDVQGAAAISYQFQGFRFESRLGVFNFFAIFRKFPNFEGKLPLWARLGDRGTIFILKWILQTYSESLSHPRSPTQC